MLADHARQLEAVEIRHADVHQHDGEVPLEQQSQRFCPGAGLDEVLTELGEDDLVGHQLLRQIVYEQDVDLLVPVHGSYRWSHIRMADSSCSVSTGLAR